MNVLDKNFVSDQLKRICEARKCSVREFSAELKMPYQTLLNYSNGSREPKWDFLLTLHEWGLNIDWFFGSSDEMYRANRADQFSYTGNGVAVHNNHGSIGVGEISSNSGGRDLRLCQFAKWWMDTHSADDQAWLEVQIKRAVPEYAEWLKGQGR